MVRIRAPKDFWSGLLFLAIGLAGVWFARNYAVGSTLRMGPGYMPTVLSWLTAILGLIVLAKSLIVDGPRVPRLHAFPTLMIVTAIAAFGLSIERFGLAAAVVVTVLIGSFASRESGLVERGLLAVGLAAFCVGVFVFALGQPMKVWPI